MNWSDNPIKDYDNWDYEQQLKEAACPVCNDCGDPITGEKYWEFHGLYYCEGCVNEHSHYLDEFFK